MTEILWFACIIIFLTFIQIQLFLSLMLSLKGNKSPIVFGALNAIFNSALLLTKFVSLYGRVLNLVCFSLYWSFWFACCAWLIGVSVTEISRSLDLMVCDGCSTLFVRFVLNFSISLSMTVSGYSFFASVCLSTLNWWSRSSGIWQWCLNF